MCKQYRLTCLSSIKYLLKTQCHIPQTWQNNMTKTADPKIKFFDGDDFTCVTFQPDLAKFKMEKLDKDIVALLTRRAYDVAGSCRGVKVTLNGKKLPVSCVELELKILQAKFWLLRNSLSSSIINTRPNLSCLQVNGFRSYVDLYVKDKLDETGVPLKVVNETVNDRWEVCLTMSEKGFQQISFVNSIATTKVITVWVMYQQWYTVSKKHYKWDT